MSLPIVNKIFSEFLNMNFDNFVVVYTDGSVSHLSAGYSFFIPELHISFSNNLPPSSSFTAECYAIIEALSLISNLASNKYLIASDSMSCLQALISNPFDSHLSSLVLIIKSIILKLHQDNYTIQFLWVSSHIGIHGNEFTDNLAKSTSNLICPSLTHLPRTDFIPILRRHISNLWCAYWSNLSAEFATRYKNIVPNVLNKTWFYNLNLPRSSIIHNSIAYVLVIFYNLLTHTN
uniref:ribonuclease H n=1 Tax=Sipha flava TaxID=143950 RepID=A0A2S2Q117_9HEMI